MCITSSGVVHMVDKLTMTTLQKEQTDILDEEMLNMFFYNLVIERNSIDRIIDVTEIKSGRVKR